MSHFSSLSVDHQNITLYFPTLFIIIFGSDWIKNVRGCSILNILLPYHPMLTKTKTSRKDLKLANFKKEKQRYGDIVDRQRPIIIEPGPILVSEKPKSTVNGLTDKRRTPAPREY